MRGGSYIVSANMGECVVEGVVEGREGGIATSQWHKLSPWDWHWWIGKRWTRAESAWRGVVRPGGPGRTEAYRFTTRQHYQTARERAHDTLRDAAGVSGKERIYHDEQIYRGPAERNSVAR